MESTPIHFVYGNGEPSGGGIHEDDSIQEGETRWAWIQRRDNSSKISLEF